MVYNKYPQIRILNFKFKLFILFIYSLVNQIDCSEIVASSYCCLGCSLCQTSSDDINNYTCMQCQNNFKLDESTNKCIYEQCSQSLFLQNSQTEEKNTNQCVALCENSYTGNNINNICEKLQKCSTLFTTANLLFTENQAIEAHQINENNFIVLYRGVSTIIDIQSSKILKTINIDENIVVVKVIQGNIFQFDQNNKLFKWDTNIEQTQLILDITQQTQIPFSPRNNIIKIGENYVCIMIVDEENKQIQFRIIFDLSSSDIIEFNNNQYQLILHNLDVLVFQNIIISQSEKIINISCIYQKELMVIEQICLINEINPIELTQTHDQNDIILVIRINKKEILYINKEQQSCKQLEIKEIKDQIQSIKVETLDESNNSILVVQEDNLIFIYNVNTDSIQQLNINQNKTEQESEFILDYQIAYLQPKYPEIVILTDFNNIYTFIIDFNSNQTKFEKTELQMEENLYINKIQPINKIYSSKLGIMLSSQKSLTILKRNSLNQTIQQAALINYVMPFPAQLGKIKQIIIAEVYSYLVLSTEDMYIQIFDISSGYEAHLIKTIDIYPDQCIDIQLIQSEKIIAVLSTKIVVINLFTSVQEKSIKLNAEQKNTPSISVNGQYTSLSINGCVSLYKNPSFEKVFEDCQNILNDRILRISLSSNLILYLFTKNTIKSVLMDTQTKKLKDLKIFTNAKIIIQFEIINVPLNDQLGNQFFIEEILMFDDSQTLSILNNNLILTHSLMMSYIKNPNMIKRAVNDSQFYVLVETFQDGNGFYQSTFLTLMKKNKSFEIIWKDQKHNYSPIIQQPFKFVNENGIEQLLIRFLLIYDEYGILVNFIISLPTHELYISQLQQIFTTSITSLYAILNIQSLVSTTYAGSDQGQLAQYNQNNKVYQVINVSQYFKNQGDEIIQIVNFQILERYFILIQSSYVLIMNIFTDEYENTIEFDTHNILNSKISVIEKNNLFIYSSKNLIFVRNYKNKSTFKDYTYSNQLTINEWLFDENESLFYVYGSGFNCLDTQLQLKKVIFSSEQFLEKCILCQRNIICKLDSTTIKIIDKLNPNSQKTIQVKGFSLSPQFKINFDFKYSRLYLIQDYAQVYTLEGAFLKSFKIIIVNLQSIDFQDDYLILSTITNCFIFDRKSYEKITDFYVAFNIVKQIYVSRIKSIIFSCNSPEVSQIFVFDIPSKSMLGKISSDFNKNDQGAVVDFIYDGENTQVLYLDEFGNLQCNVLYLSFDKMNGIQFIEMIQRNEKAVGFTLDFSTNQIYTYSKKTLYKTSYAQQNDVYLLSVSQNKRIFTIIQPNESNNIKSMCLRYLTLSDYSQIFKYQDDQMIYQYIYSSEILDINYITKNQQVIITFSNHIKVYDNYTYDMSYDWSKYRRTERFTVEKFVDDDIFITLNKQIIHYDFKNMKIISKLQLDSKSKLTTHLLLSSHEQIVFGFYNGQILLYNKSSLKSILIKNEQFKEFENKPVKFILEIDNLTLFITTIEGQIIQYNINSDQIINQYQLTKIIKHNNLEKLFLSDIKYDKTYKRLLFIFIGQNTGYIWGLQENKILSYFSGGNNQKNTITLTDKFIIVSSAFQLNFYELSSESKFISMLYGSPFYDQIQNFKIIENEIIIICDYETFKIYYFQGSSFHLIERQVLGFPFILEYLYDKDQKHIYLVLLSDSGISEVMINASYFINDRIKTCYSEINQDQTQLIQMQIQKIQQRKSYFIEYSLKVLIPSNDSEIFLNVSIDSDYISFLSDVLKKSQTQQQTVLSPINDTKNYYILSQNSFTQLEQQKFDMKNFQFKINEREIQDQFNYIKLNNQTQFVIWQNITFVQNEILKGIQINFVNLTEVIFFDIRISSQVLSFLKNNSEQPNSLFYFENVEKVSIFNLTIDYNDFSNSDYQNIIYMKQVKEVYIENTQINNNYGNINIMRFDFVNKFQIDNFKIHSNSQSDKNSNKLFILLICQGCLEIIASEIQFTQNEQVQLIQAVNYYELNEEIKTYTNDRIQLINVTLNQNNFNFQQIINITQSYISFNNFTFTSNQGNIKISDAKQITIQESLFSNNSAINGGALSVYNLKQNLILTQTIITQNQAFGSGGGIYLEDIQTKNIEFSADCKISRNNALIGGGVRILNKFQQKIIPLQYPFNQIVEQNTAELYGDNTCTFLQNILIENGNKDFDQIQNDTFKNLTNYNFNYKIEEINQQMQVQADYLGYLNVSYFKTGGDLQLNIFFIDEYQKRLQFDQNKFQQKLYPQDIIEELESLIITLKQGDGNENTVILTGETILNHNLYNQICNCFQIKQLSISAMPSISKQLQIQFQANRYVNQVSKILLEIDFRNCQLGEIISMTSINIQTCYFCSNGTYSLIEPNSIQNISQDQILCKKCPDSALNCIGNTIQLRNGYWRKDNNTDEILSCNPQINSCKSEDPESRDQGCTKGFVGPLCEVCDLGGNVWDKQYTSSFQGNKCGECEGLAIQYTFFILQGFGILIFLIYNSFRSFQSISYSLTCYYLRKLQFIPISGVQLQQLQTSFIKIILSYLQFSSLLFTHQSILPLSLNIIPDLFGSSNKVITLNIVCIIPNNLINQHGKSFVLGLINFFLPLLCIFFGIIVFQYFKDGVFPAKNQHKYIIFILLSVIYMFFLLDTIQFFTTMLTCRQIGSYFYNAVDISQQCNQEQHNMFLKALSVFFLTLWTICPLILILFLRKQKASLNQCIKKYKFGYFYLELKNEYYYWEFVRILLKILVVIIYTLLKQEYIVISRQIIALMFAQYIKLITSIKPFQSAEILQMEILSMQFIIAKILLQTSKEMLDKGIIIFEIFIFLIDFSFIIYFILKFSKQVINNSQSFLGKIFQFVFKRICSEQIYKKITKIKSTKFITYLRWKKIKNNLQYIIKQQAAYNISVLPSQIYQQQHQQQKQQSLLIVSSKINGLKLSKYKQNYIENHFLSKENEDLLTLKESTQNIFSSKDNNDLLSPKQSTNRDTHSLSKDIFSLNQSNVI